MTASVKKRKKAKVLREDCVACGACVNVCPAAAVIIHKGIWADVDHDRCIGCSKCAAICPASAIRMEIS
ncbi:MAG: 4Fe-4S binding protein [Synergistaceae bacterium]|nr:4Fe-4S binding protein [Synergistaceae bacterium]